MSVSASICNDESTWEASAGTTDGAGSFTLRLTEEAPAVGSDVGDIAATLSTLPRDTTKVASDCEAGSTTTRLVSDLDEAALEGAK